MGHVVGVELGSRVYYIEGANVSRGVYIDVMYDLIGFIKWHMCRIEVISYVGPC